MLPEITDFGDADAVDENVRVEFEQICFALILTAAILIGEAILDGDLVPVGGHRLLQHGAKHGSELSTRGGGRGCARGFVCHELPVCA